MSTKEEVFKYVMNSPENTNPAVLGSLLNGIEGGGGADLPTGEKGQILQLDPREADTWKCVDDGAEGTVITATGPASYQLLVDPTIAMRYSNFIINGLAYHRMDASLTWNSEKGAYDITSATYAALYTFGSNDAMKLNYFTITSSTSVEVSYDISSKNIAEFPDVTGADNGKVLGVVNGAWGLATDQGSVIEVTGTYYDPNHMIYPSTSLTHKDMVDAFDAGKTCRIYAQNDNVINGSLMLTPCRVVPASGSNPRYIVFNGVYRADLGDGTTGPTYYYQCKVQDGSTASLSQGIPASRTSITDYTPST